mmetsp:Transcript_16290/g.35329  ORF Transcript_16290/g.35329 Transcript_16290/m.35329 type:complete len:745 (+) Transcript_16290:218-2452(+)
MSRPGNSFGKRASAPSAGKPNLSSAMYRARALMMEEPGVSASGATAPSGSTAPVVVGAAATQNGGGDSHANSAIVHGVDRVEDHQHASGSEGASGEWQSPLRMRNLERAQMRFQERMMSDVVEEEVLMDVYNLPKEELMLNNTVDTMLTDMNIDMTSINRNDIARARREDHEDQAAAATTAAGAAASSSLAHTVSAGSEQQNLNSGFSLPRSSQALNVARLASGGSGDESSAARSQQQQQQQEQKQAQQKRHQQQQQQRVSAPAAVGGASKKSSAGAQDDGAEIVYVELKGDAGSSQPAGGADGGERGSGDTPLNVRDSYMHFALESAGLRPAKTKSRPRSSTTAAPATTASAAPPRWSGKISKADAKAARDGEPSARDSKSSLKERVRTHSRSKAASVVKNIAISTSTAPGAARERAYSRGGPGLRSSRHKGLSFMRNVGGGSKIERQRSGDSYSDSGSQANGSQPRTTWKQAVSQSRQKDGASVLALRVCPVPVVSDLEMSAVGARTSVDVFAMVHNGIRRDLMELYLLLMTLSKRLAQLELHDIAAFFEWWQGTRTNLVEALELRESVVFGAMESADATLQFDLSGPKRRTRFSSIYRYVGAIDELELVFVKRENDSAFVELVDAANSLRATLVTDFALCENDAAAVLETAFDGPQLVRLEAQLYSAMYKHASAEILLPAAVAWMSDSDMMKSWESKHMRGFKRIRFKRMLKTYLNKHMAIPVALTNSLQTSAPWFKRVQS